MKSKIQQEGIKFIYNSLCKDKERILREIKELQDTCSHPNVIKENRGDSGNILTGRDASYWRHCKCPDCGKVWNENQ